MNKTNFNQSVKEEESTFMVALEELLKSKLGRALMIVLIITMIFTTIAIGWMSVKVASMEEQLDAISEQVAE